MLNLLKKKDFQIEKSKNLLLLLLLIQVNFSFGQDLSYFYGKVVDARTGSPLAFASIVQKDKSVGLISNDDGSFKIPKYYEVARVTLVISFIGYYSEEIKVTDLKKNDLNIIKLTERTESLNEIVIKSQPRPLTAHQIVERAIKNIKKNYPLDPFSYVGYYRDYQKNEEQDYINLNEAILQVHDRGFRFKDYASTRTNIFKYEKNLEFPRDSIAAKPYDYRNKTKVIDRVILGHLSDNANEFTLLRIHDAIRNYNVNTYDFVNNLEIDFVRNHNFIISKETSIDNVALYEIKFMKEINKVIASGEIYISKEDYKIYKFHYSIYEKGRKRRNPVENTFASAMNGKTSPDKLIFNVIVEYANYNETMYPKYISFNNPFEVLQPPKFVPTDAQFGFTNYGGPTILFVDIIFNNKLDPKKALKKKNYILGYKGNRLRIDSIRVMNDIARVYPNDKDVQFPKEAWLNGQRLVGKDFSLELKNIKDVDGNVVFKGEMASFNQYREFFIQELNTNSQQPKDTLFMMKNRPFSKNQPIKAPKDISKYWMNTPLKE